MRLLDKAQMFKVEVWVKYPNKEANENYLKQQYRLEQMFEGLDREIKFFPHKH
jgi:hypothetical protein